MKDLEQKLKEVAGRSPHWAELRYHRRNTQSLRVQKGLVKQLESAVTAGVGIRVLVDGAWGFSSTSDLSLKSIERALKKGPRLRGYA